VQDRITLKSCLAIILISAAVAIGLNNIISFINLAEYSKSYQKTAELLYAPSFPKQILYFGICVPIIEELIFRGFLFQFLRKRVSFVVAMFGSAVVFGLYHGNLVQFVYATICGLLLAYFCEKCHSVLASVLSHMSMNIVVCTMVYVKGFEWILGDMGRAIVFTGLCTALVLLGLRYSSKWMLQKC